jgi:alpha-amylase
LSRTFQTSLPAGTYCDVMSGDVGNGSCTGATYTVDRSGQVPLAVPAIHIGARTTGGGAGAT